MPGYQQSTHPTLSFGIPRAKPTLGFQRSRLNIGDLTVCLTSMLIHQLTRIDTTKIRYLRSVRHHLVCLQKYSIRLLLFCLHYSLIAIVRLPISFPDASLTLTLAPPIFPVGIWVRQPSKPKQCAHHLHISWDVFQQFSKHFENKTYLYVFLVHAMALKIILVDWANRLPS